MKNQTIMNIEDHTMDVEDIERTIQLYQIKTTISKWKDPIITKILQVLIGDNFHLYYILETKINNDIV